MHHATTTVAPRDHARWQWWVTFATVSGPPWFNRHFLAQWTALWVIRIPPLPAVALYLTASSGWKSLPCVCQRWERGREVSCVVIAGVSEQGQLYTHTHTHTRTVNSHPHLPDVHTPNQPSSLTSVHPCVSNWNMNGFSLGWNRIGLLLLLTGLASLPTDCSHGYPCCHNTPATSAKSTKL